MCVPSRKSFIILRPYVQLIQILLSHPSSCFLEPAPGRASHLNSWDNLSTTFGCIAVSIAVSRLLKPSKVIEYILDYEGERAIPKFIPIFSYSDYEARIYPPSQENTIGAPSPQADHKITRPLHRLPLQQLSTSE